MRAALARHERRRPRERAAAAVTVIASRNSERRPLRERESAMAASERRDAGIVGATAAQSSFGIFLFDQ